jgi:Ca-activated chloride channel family protein
MLLFADYKYLYLLLLIPVFLLGYALLRGLRKRRVKAFGEPELVNALMPSRSRSKGWVRMVLFCLGFLFFVLGLARPQTGAKLSERKTKGAEIIVALDVSNSMLAQDYSPNRLERAKLAISRLTDLLQDDRIGLVIFAGTSFVQLPVTTDYVSAKMFLSSIDTGSIPIQGTAIGDAIRLSIKSFSAQSEKSRVIIVISDGENHEDDPVAAAKDAAEFGIKVYTIGVGSAEGQPIPVEGGSLLRDSKGEIVVTKLDEKTLREIARAGNGAYIHAGNEEFGLNPIVQDIRRLEDEEFGSIVFEEYDEQYMYFFGIALLLFVIEMLIGERKPRRKLFEL